MSAQSWERDLFAFVREEFAPSPARWHAALRTTLACLVGIVLIMALRIPDGEFLMVSLFIVSNTDAWASTNRAVLRVIGTWVGGGLAILAIIALGDKPWLLLPLQAAVISTAIFLTRTTTAPYAFMIAGITFLLVAPEAVTDPAFDVERGLWRTLLTTLGVLMGTGAQLLLWPDHPEGLLLRDLGRRLSLVEALVERLTRKAAARRPALLGDPVGATGMSGQLDLLREAEATSPFLRQRHTEQIKLIVDVQRLVSAAIRLERLSRDVAELPPWVSERLADVARECRRLREAMDTRRSPSPRPRHPSPAPDGRGSEADWSLETLAAIEEMEGAVAEMPGLLVFLEVPTEGREVDSDRLPREPVAERTLFTPACSLANVEIVQHALKAGLAATICGVIYTGVHRPALATCVITCLVVAQSTVGAARHKSILRLVGTLMGGLGALIAILVFVPNMTSLASLLVVAAPLFFATAWVIAGSSRSAYLGVQMGIGLSLVLINGPMQTIDLAPALDRFLGIVLGTVVFGIVDLAVWPVFARGAIRRKLREALKLMAEFHRVAAAGDREAIHRRAVAIYKTLSDAVALQDGLNLEPEVHEADGAERRGALRLTSSLQSTFLNQLAVSRHRTALEGVPAPDLESVRNLDEETTDLLEELGTDAAHGTPPARARLDALARVSASPPTREFAVVYRDLLDSLDRLTADMHASDHL